MRKITLHRDDSTTQVVFENVKHFFFTAGNTVTEQQIIDRIGELRKELAAKDAEIARLKACGRFLPDPDPDPMDEVTGQMDVEIAQLQQLNSDLAAKVDELQEKLATARRDALEEAIERLQKDGSEDGEGSIDLQDTIDRIRALSAPGEKP